MNQEFIEWGKDFKQERLNKFGDIKDLENELGDNVTAIEDGFLNIVSTETFIKYLYAIGLELSIKKRRKH